MNSFSDTIAGFTVSALDKTLGSADSDALLSFISNRCDAPLDSLKNGRIYIELRKRLEDLGVVSMIAEASYVDGMYLDDYANHYSGAFNQSRKHCSRIHFFSKSISEQELDILLSKGEEAKVEKLQRAYRGYVIIRPTAVAPYGKICLACPMKDGLKVLSKTNNVNIGGMQFSVESIPLCESDNTISACASSAIWSALRVAGSLNERSMPSLGEITKKALNIEKIGNRLSPGELDYKNISNALACYGLDSKYLNLKPRKTASVEEAKDKSAEEVAKEKEKSEKYLKTIINYIKAYLNSDFPVLVGGRFTDSTDEDGEQIGHLVTILGFSEDGEQVEALVHDDRYGQYLEVPLIEVFDQGALKLQIPKGVTADLLLVDFISVPLDYKVRLDLQVVFEITQRIKAFIYQISLDWASKFKCKGNKSLFDLLSRQGLELAERIDETLDKKTEENETFLKELNNYTSFFSLNKNVQLEKSLDALMKQSSQLISEESKIELIKKKYGEVRATLKLASEAGESLRKALDFGNETDSKIQENDWIRKLAKPLFNEKYEDLGEEDIGHAKKLIAGLTFKDIHENLKLYRGQELKRKLLRKVESKEEALKHTSLGDSMADIQAYPLPKFVWVWEERSNDGLKLDILFDATAQKTGNFLIGFIAFNPEASALIELIAQTVRSRKKMRDGFYFRDEINSYYKKGEIIYNSVIKNLVRIFEPNMDHTFRKARFFSDVVDGDGNFKYAIRKFSVDSEAHGKLIGVELNTNLLDSLRNSKSILWLMDSDGYIRLGPAEKEVAVSKGNTETTNFDHSTLVEDGLFRLAGYLNRHNHSEVRISLSEPSFDYCDGPSQRDFLERVVKRHFSSDCRLEECPEDKSSSYLIKGVLYDPDSKIPFSEALTFSSLVGRKFSNEEISSLKNGSLVWALKEDGNLILRPVSDEDTQKEIEELAKSKAYPFLGVIHLFKGRKLKLSLRRDVSEEGRITTEGEEVLREGLKSLTGNNELKEEVKLEKEFYSLEISSNNLVYDSNIPFQLTSLEKVLEVAGSSESEGKKVDGGKESVRKGDHSGVLKP